MLAMPKYVGGEKKYINLKIQDCQYFNTKNQTAKAVFYFHSHILYCQPL